MKKRRRSQGVGSFRVLDAAATMPVEEADHRLDFENGEIYERPPLRLPDGMSIEAYCEGLRLMQRERLGK